MYPCRVVVVDVKQRELTEGVVVSGAEEMLQVACGKSSDPCRVAVRVTNNTGSQILLGPRSTVEIQLILVKIIRILIVNVKLIVGLGGKSQQRRRASCITPDDRGEILILPD